MWAHKKKRCCATYLPGPVEHNHPGKGGKEISSSQSLLLGHLFLEKKKKKKPPETEERR